MKDSDELPMMTRTLVNKGCDPLYNDDIEIAALLLYAGWSKSIILRNFEAIKTMASIRFENERRRRSSCLGL